MPPSGTVVERCFVVLQNMHWLFLHCTKHAFAPKQAFRKFLPMFDRVLVERLAAETVTKGGIMIPEKSQTKVLQATVVAVGPGSTNKVALL